MCFFGFFCVSLIVDLCGTIGLRDIMSFSVSFSVLFFIVPLYYFVCQSRNLRSVDSLNLSVRSWQCCGVGCVPWCDEMILSVFCGLRSVFLCLCAFVINECFLV